MPRVSKKHARYRTGYTLWHYTHLLTGGDYFGEGFGQGERCDLAAMRAAWEDSGADLVALHVSQYPGTRPYAWWEFTAKERRRRVDGMPHPHEDGSTPVPWNTLAYGLPRYMQTEDHFTATYESQTAYLLRLGLLTRAERRSDAGYSAQVQRMQADEDDSPTLGQEEIQAWMAEL